MENDGTKPDSQPRDPFAVDVEHALDALALAWGGEYDEIWLGHDGEWGAHRKDAGEDDVLTGATPDALNRVIRADQERRAALRLPGPGAEELREIFFPEDGDTL